MQWICMCMLCWLLPLFYCRCKNVLSINSIRFLFHSLLSLFAVEIYISFFYFCFSYSMLSICLHLEYFLCTQTTNTVLSGVGWMVWNKSHTQLLLQKRRIWARAHTHTHRKRVRINKNQLPKEYCDKALLILQFGVTKQTDRCKKKTNDEERRREMMMIVKW